MRVRADWTTREERQRIVDEALALLEGAGMRYGEGDALGLLAAAGAKVDRARGLARFRATSSSTRCAAARDVVLGGASPANDCVLTRGEPHVGNPALANHDRRPRIAAHRESTLEDLR